MKETGFQPNELARALYKKSSKMIGMIVPDIENPFFSELAKAVEDTAYQNGYRILLCSSGGDEEKEAVNIQMFNQLRADRNRCDDELRRDRESVGGLSDTGRPC